MTTLFDSISLGRSAAEACADKAESQGWDSIRAADFIVGYLAQHGPTPGEVLVNEASKGNQPHDGRAFGAVFLRLKRQGRIEQCGFARRVKGHGTAGGVVWKLA